MRINAISIGGFGVWSGLELAGLADEVNVFFGPNEAGKTTLLEFIRAQLFGYSAEGRRRYLAMRGEAAGGALTVTSGTRRLTITRQPVGSGAEELVRIVDDEGVLIDPTVMQTLLAGVDEATYNNVYALGLRELQELATLNDTAAAELLYKLTIGIDRVSLADVLRDLDAAARELLSDQASSQIAALLDQRARLLGEVQQLRAYHCEFARLLDERSALEQDLAAAEARRAALAGQSALLNAALAVQADWDERRRADEQLAQLATAELPAGAADQFNVLQRRIAARKRRLAVLDASRKTLLGQLAELPVNDALWRQSPRAETLLDQRPWINSLEAEVGKLSLAVTDLSRRRETELAALDVPEHAIVAARRRLSADTLTLLRLPARACREAGLRLKQARQENDEAQFQAEALSEQVDQALGGRAENSLGPALEKAGALVSQLRRRVQLDERLEQMTRHQSELVDHSHDLLAQQAQPAWFLLVAGAVFALGIALVLAGLVLPQSVVGPAGWSLSALGLVGAGCSAGAKLWAERLAARRLRHCQQQAQMLAAQITQARQERDLVDGQLPQGGGPMTARLQAAERHLAELEELLAVDTQRDLSARTAEAAGARLKQAEHDYRAAAHRWKRALAQAGLPDHFSPRQVRRFLRRLQRIDALSGQLERRRRQQEQRRRELDALSERIAAIIASVGLPPGQPEPLARLDHLQQALEQEVRHRAQRDQLQRQFRQLRHQRRQLEGKVARLQRQRQTLLRSLGVAGEDELQRRLELSAQAAALRAGRGHLQERIAATLAQLADEQSVAALLDGPEAADPAARRGEIADALAATEAALRRNYERRGQLDQQVRQHRHDRRLATRLLALGEVESRLQETLRRWRSILVTRHLLHGIRARIEAQRQPATLREASHYLARLTEGHYVRVWTPVDEDILNVDDAAGNTLPVDVLSRGTREQLFLALRLAVVTALERRGAALPLVFDDVLVNFDAQRAQAAAELLRDFSRQGRQVLLMTCHEHFLSMFAALDADCRTLPDCRAERAAVCRAAERQAMRLPAVAGGTVRLQQTAAENPTSAPADEHDGTAEVAWASLFRHAVPFASAIWQEPVEVDPADLLAERPWEGLDEALGNHGRGHVPAAAARLRQATDDGPEADDVEAA